jgi:RNA polymerase sigma-70 factor (ECF subfamily)
MGEFDGELILSGFDGRPDLARSNPDDLVIRAQSGETGAFERLMERHESLVLRTALRMLGDRDDALDAAQEVFVRLYRSLKQVDPARPLEPWLYRTTLNACHDLAKKRKRWSITDSAIRPESTTDGTEKRLDAESAMQVIEEGLRHLPDRERAAITLRDIEGLDTRQVASIMHVGESTVRSLISKARVNLRRFREKRWGHDHEL